MIINWHRLFGLFLIDFFADSAFEVELEKDLSLKQQFLDVVIVRKRHLGEIKSLPDGLENLKQHNLLSYKSLHEPFDAWALKELSGHYVNYRKQVSASFADLLPEKQFQLYGVSTRFPQKLAKQVDFQLIKPGVYELVWGVDTVRIIVLSEISNAEYNAVWRLFSAKPNAVMQAKAQYQPHSSEMSSIINQLFENYRKEKVLMSYTMQDFQKEFVLDHLNLLSPAERVKNLSPAEIIKNLSPTEIVKNLSPVERVKNLSIEERLNGLSAEEVKAWMEKLNSNPE